jgi:glutathione S-transferase
VIILWGSSGGRSCRCLLALEEMGLGYEHRPLRPWDSEADRARLAGLNPNGRVPVLQDGEVRICESIAINLYLGDRYGGPLWPARPEDRALLYQWSLWTQTEVDVMARHRARHGDDPARKARALAERREKMAILDAALADRPWLLGEAFSLADVNVAACLSEPWENGLIDGDLDPAADGMPALGDWLKRCVARPSWERVRALP